MPSITDFKNIKKTNKVFKKKEYRPWGIEEEIITPPSKIIKSENNNLSSKTTQIPSSSIDIELEKTWRCLYGAKRTLLEIIIKNIEEEHDSYVITKAITVNQLFLASSVPVNTIKTSLQQLKQNFLISNYETKPGRGGFARYKISKNVYEYFIKKFS
jgi:hypothetical protein